MTFTQDELKMLCMAMWEYSQVLDTKEELARQNNWSSLPQREAESKFGNELYEKLKGELICA